MAYKVLQVWDIVRWWAGGADWEIISIAWDNYWIRNLTSLHYSIWSWRKWLRFIRRPTQTTPLPTPTQEINTAQSNKKLFIKVKWKLKPLKQYIGEVTKVMDIGWEKAYFINPSIHPFFKSYFSLPNSGWAFRRNVMASHNGYKIVWFHNTSSYSLYIGVDNVEHTLIQVTKETYDKYVELFGIEWEKVIQVQLYSMEKLIEMDISLEQIAYLCGVCYSTRVGSQWLFTNINWSAFPVWRTNREYAYFSKEFAKEIVSKNFPLPFIATYNEAVNDYKTLSDIETNDEGEIVEFEESDWVYKASKGLLKLLRSRFIFASSESKKKTSLIRRDFGWEKKYELYREGKNTQPIFYKSLEDKENNLFFGCEIEFHNANKEAIYKKLMKDDDVRSEMYFMSDGSLNNGLETATHPFTKDFYLKKWRNTIIKFLNIIKKDWGQYDNGSGLHIHISRKGFNGNEKRLRTFVVENKTEFQKIAWREEGYYFSYVDDDKGRYRAVNLRPTKTCEMRIFKSTTNTDELLGRIEATIALTEYINSKTPEMVLSMDEYIEFVKNSSEFTYWKKYFETLFPNSN